MDSLNTTLASQVNPKFYITQDQVVASLFNTGNVYAGHAMIVTESVDENGKLTVGQYEVRSKLVASDTLSEKVQRATGNSQGYIAEIRILKKDSYTYPKDFADLSSKSWYATPEEIQRMVEAIRADKQSIDTAIANSQPLPLLYQTAGSRRWWWLGGNGIDARSFWA